MTKKDKVFRCKRCGNIVQLTSSYSAERLTESSEDRCPDPKAPGGYWYCDYEELVPKTTKKGHKQ